MGEECVINQTWQLLIINMSINAISEFKNQIERTQANSKMNHPQESAAKWDAQTCEWVYIAYLLIRIGNYIKKKQVFSELRSTKMEKRVNGIDVCFISEARSDSSEVDQVIH